MSRSTSTAGSASDGPPEYSFQAISQPPSEAVAMLRAYCERQSSVRQAFLVWFWPARRPMERRQLLCIDVAGDAAAIESGVGGLLRARPAQIEIDLLVIDPTDDGTAELMRTITEPFFVRR